MRDEDDFSNSISNPYVHSNLAVLAAGDWLDRDVSLVHAFPSIRESEGTSIKIKQILEAFKNELKELYGDRFIALVLYGSFARGEENEDSDVDVLVILKSIQSHFQEIQRMSSASTEALLVHGELLSVVPMSHEKFLSDSSPLLRNVREEGLIV